MLSMFVACNKRNALVKNGPTVYDIAEYLGVSPATVSRTLNGSRLVSAQMRERVRDAAAEMGYSRRVIRRPKSRSILNIALFLPITGARYAQLFYDVAELVTGVEMGLESVRANIVVDLVGNTGLFEQKKIGDLHGCIFAFCRPDSITAASIDDRRLPVALVNRTDDSRTSIVPDHEGGMATLVRQVTARGHRRVCYLGFGGAAEISEVRRRGFEVALHAVGGRADEASLKSVADIAEITPSLARGIHDEGFTACLCFNDVVAMRLLDSARQAGLQVPGDLSLTGFDDSPILELASTRIDTVSLSTAELGRQAAEWLSAAVFERSTAIVRKLVATKYVPGETIARRTQGGSNE
jgi:LacI family transcriptional regulator